VYENLVTIRSKYYVSWGGDGMRGWGVWGRRARSAGQEQSVKRGWGLSYLEMEQRLDDL
jgi:hypothetical protein